MRERRANAARGAHTDTVVLGALIREAVIGFKSGEFTEICKREHSNMFGYCIFGAPKLWTVMSLQAHSNKKILNLGRSDYVTDETYTPGAVRMPEPQRSGLQMKLLDALVEQRIAAAAARGEFDELPGAGAPLHFGDDPLVPEEVRIANRILKNAGFVPPAIEQLRALHSLQDEMAAVSDRATRCQLQVKMLALDMALESLRGGPMLVPREYCRRIAERLSERVAGDAADDTTS